MEVLKKKCRTCGREEEGSFEDLFKIFRAVNSVDNKKKYLLNQCRECENKHTAELRKSGHPSYSFIKKHQSYDMEDYGKILLRKVARIGRKNISGKCRHVELIPRRKASGMLNSWVGRRVR